MAKRKREDPSSSAAQTKKTRSSEKSNSNGSVEARPSSPPTAHAQDAITIQVVTGSYERVLHGIQATVPSATLASDSPKEDTVQFSDTFLFAAHSSAIRCLALSPFKTDDAKSQDVFLASGATDERINLYSLSIRPAAQKKADGKPAPVDLNLTGRISSENRKNRELGSLLHHSSTVSGLYFPSRSKLLTAAEDSTIAFVRTRDWTVLSSLKAPIPKPVGRPSGDTAAPGEIPAGINDFAVHPSNKLMVSVGKGERCMRLWNLVTGKKAGVLNFGKDVLQQVGEGKWASGEGRKVEWNSEGEEFVVTFDRGAIVYSMVSLLLVWPDLMLTSLQDCTPKALLIPEPRSKVHQIKYVQDKPNLVSMSTEDGRILFFDTNSMDEVEGKLPRARLQAQLGGREAGLVGRVKDFEMLQPETGEGAPLVIVTGSSDGAVRLWSLRLDQSTGRKEEQNGDSSSSKQIGQLLGTYETGNRITCLRAFIMVGDPEEVSSNGVEDPADDLSSDSSDDD
jgi:protein MAK11